MYCLGPPIESALSALPCGAIQNVLMGRRPGCSGGERRGSMAPKAHARAQGRKAGGAIAVGGGANGERVGDALEATSVMLLHVCRIQ